MAIAVFIKQLSVGGAEKQSLLLTRELQKHYPAYLVVWSRKIVSPGYQDFIEMNNLNVIFLEGTALHKAFFLWRFFKEKRVSCLFNFLLLNNFVGGLTGRLARVRKIYGGIRNCEIASGKLLWQKIVHNYISHHTIFNNYAGTVTLSKQGFRKDKMLVIHNGIDVDGEIHLRQEALVPVIFTAARFLPQKDYFTALEAIQILKRRGRNFRYVIAGYGLQENEIKAGIEKLEIEDCTEMKIAPDNIKELYRQADIYLSTSLKEGLSNSIMEAMAAALPVVATNVGDNEHLVENGRTGYLVDRKSPVQVADALEKFLDNYQSILQMGGEGFQRLKDKFSTSLFLNRYKALTQLVILLS
jgi:glycosyltransferase involved in cell wall biosynthesis